MKWFYDVVVNITAWNNDGICYNCTGYVEYNNYAWASDWYVLACAVNSWLMPRITSPKHIDPYIPITDLLDMEQCGKIWLYNYIKLSKERWLNMTAHVNGVWGILEKYKGKYEWYGTIPGNWMYRYWISGLMMYGDVFMVGVYRSFPHTYFSVSDWVKICVYNLDTRNLNWRYVIVTVVVETECLILFTVPLPNDPKIKSVNYLTHSVY